MSSNKKQYTVTREEFLRLIAVGSAAAVLPIGYSSKAAATIENDTQTIVNFNWSDPECPEREVGDLDQYFFGDLDHQDGFHLNDGSSVAESPDGCVLRTDGDEVLIYSLPEEHPSQRETLEKYPERGETIVFDHYVHRTGANMEFRFGVQEDLENHYVIRFESDSPSISLLRVEDGLETELSGINEFSYTDQQFHTFVIEWEDEGITVSLVQDDTVISISAEDDTYDIGGIGFYKEGRGIIFSYTHLWNNVEVVTEFEFDPDAREDPEEDILEESKEEDTIDYEIVVIDDTSYAGVERYRVDVVTPTPCEFDSKDAARVIEDVFKEVQRAHWISVFVYHTDDDIEGIAQRGIEYLPDGDRDLAGEHPPAETSDDLAYEFNIHHDTC